MLENKKVLKKFVSDFDIRISDFQPTRCLLKNSVAFGQERAAACGR
jgi:hypothetical protein